jgi:DNA-binding transcriptional ArsR family regulator
MIGQFHDSGTERHTPLAPPTLYIFVALAAGPRSARDIAAEVQRISAATVSERTIGRLLRRLRALDIVTDPHARSGTRSRELALTPLGIVILRGEIMRLRSLIDRLDVQALCEVSPRIRPS